MTEHRVEPVSWSHNNKQLQAIRKQVFVEEQGVPLDLELDDFDATASHLIAFNQDGIAVATGRMLADGHIGRMAVLAPWRNHGYGRALLNGFLASARASGLRRVFLHAQISAIGFYEKSGFTSVGETFMDAGIPHRKMERSL